MSALVANPLNGAEHSKRARGNAVQILVEISRDKGSGGPPCEGRIGAIEPQHPQVLFLDETIDRRCPSHVLVKVLATSPGFDPHLPRIASSATVRSFILCALLIHQNTLGARCPSFHPHLRQRAWREWSQSFPHRTYNRGLRPPSRAHPLVRESEHRGRASIPPQRIGDRCTDAAAHRPAFGHAQ